MRPTCGPAAGGSAITFSGNGFDRFFGNVSDTLCRWDHGADASVTTPLLLTPTTLVCPSAAHAPGEVVPSIALNLVDFVNHSSSFRYYESPTFLTATPLAGSSNGDVQVTIVGAGFERAGDASQVRCRWGATHTTVPISMDDNVIVCASAWRVLDGDVRDPLYLALNGQDYEQTGFKFRYFVESVANVSVESGPSGGPVDGGTHVLVRGTAMQAVTHCLFGNDTVVREVAVASIYDMLCYAMLCYAMLCYAMLCYAMLCYAMLCYAMEVAVASTPDEVVCPSPEAGGLDGGAFGSVAVDTERRRLTATTRRGSVPVQLSRDGASFFMTATTFYFYPPPANFTAIYPGGGPVLSPTNVTLYGEGLAAFTALPEHVRCRFGEAASDVTTPHFVSDTQVSCAGFPSATAGTVQLFVSLNMHPARFEPAMSPGAARAARNLLAARAQGRRLPRDGPLLRVLPRADNAADGLPGRQEGLPHHGADVGHQPRQGRGHRVLSVRHALPRALLDPCAQPPTCAPPGRPRTPPQSTTRTPAASSPSRVARTWTSSATTRSRRTAPRSSA
jgi:hypothetical protein